MLPLRFVSYIIDSHVRDARAARRVNSVDLRPSVFFEHNRDVLRTLMVTFIFVSTYILYCFVITEI